MKDATLSADSASKNPPYHPDGVFIERNFESINDYFSREGRINAFEKTDDTDTSDSDQESLASNDSQHSKTETPQSAQKQELTSLEERNTFHALADDTDTSDSDQESLASNDSQYSKTETPQIAKRQKLNSGEAAEAPKPVANAETLEAPQDPEQRKKWIEGEVAKIPMLTQEEHEECRNNALEKLHYDTYYKITDISDNEHVKVLKKNIYLKFFKEIINLGIDDKTELRHSQSSILRSLSSKYINDRKTSDASTIQSNNKVPKDNKARESSGKNKGEIWRNYTKDRKDKLVKFLSSDEMRGKMHDDAAAAVNEKFGTNMVHQNIFSIRNADEYKNQISFRYPEVLEVYLERCKAALAQSTSRES